jgi:hypothetical protein
MRQNQPYNTTHELANMYLAQKRHNFDPLLRSLMQQASENLEHNRRQAEVLAHSTSHQALQTEKNHQETTIQQSYCRKWAVMTAHTS